MSEEIDPIDRHVGEQIRLRRLQIKMSQQALAQACNVTFQQVQKYERGSNRVSASMLVRIARRLDVPVAFFFEGLEQPAAGDGKSSAEIVAARDAMREMLGQPGGLAVIRAFNKSAYTRRLLTGVAGLALGAPQDVG